MTDGTGTLIVHYEYDAAGRLSKKTLGNGVYTTYDYDAAGNVLHLVNHEPDGSVLSRLRLHLRRLRPPHLDDARSTARSDLRLRPARPAHERHLPRRPRGAATTTTRPATASRSSTTASTTDLHDQQPEPVHPGRRHDVHLRRRRQHDVARPRTASRRRYSYDIENRLIGVDDADGHLDLHATTPSATASPRRQNGVVTNYVIDPIGLGNVAAEYDGSGNVVARLRLWVWPHLAGPDAAEIGLLLHVLGDREHE